MFRKYSHLVYFDETLTERQRLRQFFIYLIYVLLELGPAADLSIQVLCGGKKEYLNRVLKKVDRGERRHLTVGPHCVFSLAEQVPDEHKPLRNGLP